jgi:hypothetical protein
LGQKPFITHGGPPSQPSAHIRLPVPAALAANNAVDHSRCPDDCRDKVKRGLRHLKRASKALIEGEPDENSTCKESNEDIVDPFFKHGFSW